MDEEELHGKYQYGTQPPRGDQYSKEFESFKGTPYGQNASYAADFNDNIRVVENYKNIRDLKLKVVFRSIVITLHKQLSM